MRSHFVLEIELVTWPVVLESHHARVIFDAEQSTRAVHFALFVTRHFFDEIWLALIALFVSVIIITRTGLVLFVLFFYNFFTLRSLITCHRPLHILVVIVLVVLETHIRELALPWLIGRLWLGSDTCQVLTHAVALTHRYGLTWTFVSRARGA